METSPQLLTAEQHSDSETRQTLDQRREEIIIKVFEVLSEHFDVPADDIEMHNTLIDDFNADSISITALDAALAVAFGVDTGRIVGRCYSQFGFREILDAPGNVENGEVTLQGLVAFREQYPNADVDRLAKNPRICDICTIVTVASIVDVIHGKMISVE